MMIDDQYIFSVADFLCTFVRVHARIEIRTGSSILIGCQIDWSFLLAQRADYLESLNLPLFQSLGCP
jgi:hypothetical protein